MSVTSIDKEEFLKSCQTGDILLYNSNTIIGRTIELLSYSKFSHISIILRDPTFINPELKGLYVIESGSEKIKDVISGKKVIGVQVIPLDYVLSQYQNASFGYLYYRKLDCMRDQKFNDKMKEIVMTTDGKFYDINPLDWIKAKFDIEIGDEQKENTFWCSALASYIYVKLGFLEKTLPWTIIAPRRFSYYEDERLTFVDCKLSPEQFIKF
tara:strand:+ start:2091 stop:2723 length:633 start_codon:yes stop_codon:yes gene_type:complete